jgi:non-heme chloroperoxidase
MLKDKAQFFIDVPSGPFFGFNRPGATVSQGRIWQWWQQGMLCGFKNAFECIEAFSETDLSTDIERIDIPVLVLHGDDDQVVPIEASARKTIKLLKNGTLKEIPGGPHGLHTIFPDNVESEIANFLEST